MSNGSLANMGNRDVGAMLGETLISVNESDRNLEPANVVDGLFAIARALQSVAEAIRNRPL
jgi:hypothetical protein